MEVLVAFGLRFLALIIHTNLNSSTSSILELFNNKYLIDWYECIVINYNGLESSCSLYMSLIPSFISKLIVTTMDESTFNIATVIMSVFLQLLIILLLNMIHPSPLWTLGLSFNIFYITQCVLDPFTTFLQFLIVLVLYFARNNSKLYFAPFIALISYDVRYFICLPSLYAMSIDSKVKLLEKERHNDHHVNVSNRYLILLILFWLFVWLMTMSFIPTIIYNPPLSLSWYLSLQCFSDYEEYFASLLHLQPLLYALPMWVRFIHKQPYLCFSVQLVLISMFDQHVSLGNIMFIWLLLYADIDGHENINVDVEIVGEDIRSIEGKEVKGITKVTAIAQVTMGITAAISISCMPVVMEMWLTTAMGNSNFVFFQTLALWLSGAVLLLEFIRGKIVQENEMEQKFSQKYMKSNKED